MSQMSQFKFKSGIEIVLPVPSRRASAFRGPAPKERKNAAHGASRGEPRSHDEEALEGRKKLVPDVTLVISYVVLLEERCKLLVKRMPLIVLRDIFCDGLQHSIR
jgi:hypothetical protein